MLTAVTKTSTISTSSIATRARCEQTAWAIWALLACPIQECVIYVRFRAQNSLELTYTLTQTANYQRQMQLPPQPRRPTSRQSVMSGSHSSLMSSNYMPIYPNPQFAPFRQPSMTSIGQVQQQQQPEWQDAMVKMEHCLAMLNSLQMTPNQMTQMPNQMPMMSQQQQPPQQQMVQQQPMLRSIPPFRPTVNQVQR